MGGGGGSSGGSVVQTTAPWAAMQAGELGANAAKEASTLSTNAINTAISQMNASYQKASYALQPYRASGVEALNKLNSYLGLSAYNPGNAPKSLQEQAAAYANDNKRIKSYIDENVSRDDAMNAFRYGGVGVDEFNAQGDKYWGRNPQDPEQPGMSNPVKSLNMLYGNQAIQNNVKKYLMDEFLNDPTKVEGINQTQNEYNQMKASYDKYNAQGPMTQAQITDSIVNQPGYQAELDQGIQAISKDAGARGYIGSGRALKELMNFGQNTLSKYYGNTLSQLAAQAGQGQQAATATAGVYSNQGNNLASLYTTMGENQANSVLAAANSRANALTAANQKFDVIGGQESGGGGLGGIGQLLGGAASLASSFGFSSRKLKNKTSTPSTKEILDKVEQLELDQWKYKGIDREHLGPYAEQFQELFGVGNGQSINMIDVCGVLLGAVKELSHKINKLQEGK